MACPRFAPTIRIQTLGSENYWSMVTPRARLKSGAELTLAKLLPLGAPRFSPYRADEREIIPTGLYLTGIGIAGNLGPGSRNC